MIRGLYTSGYGMRVLEKKMDIITNNMANASTAAYKKDSVVLQSFPDILTQRINDTRSTLNPSGIVGNMSLGSDIGEVYTYYNQGQLIKYDDNLDMAIADSDSAFFTVMVPDANGDMKEYYTRNGSFKLGPDGQLMTSDGYAVEGENGTIKLKGSNFQVGTDGTIFQDGETIGKLLIKEFTDSTTLRKSGSNLVGKTDRAEEKPFSGTIRQGYLEESNVNIVKEMVDMITVMRSYEANQKILQSEDSTLDKAVNQVGSV